MRLVVALVLLVAAGLTLITTTWAARWVAGLAFGRRSVVDAVRPWSDVGYPMALVRAVAGTMGWYFGASLLAIVPLVIGGVERADETSMRVHVVASGPASRAGLLDGDRIVRVDGAPIHDWETLKTATASHFDTPAHIEVERSGAILAFDVVPESGKIRVVPPLEHADVGLGDAVARGLAEPARVVVLTGVSLFRTLGGGARVDAVGPAGVVEGTPSAGHDGFGLLLEREAMLAAYVLPFILLLSLALASTLRRSSR